MNPKRRPPAPNKTNFNQPNPETSFGFFASSFGFFGVSLCWPSSFFYLLKKLTSASTEPKVT